MSKNNALETYFLNWAVGGAHAQVNGWRLELYKHDADANTETDAADAADYTGYAPVVIASSKLTVSGNTITLNETQTFGKNTGAAQEIERVALALSVDGGATYPYKVYGDSDLAQTVPTNGTPQVVAGTGFTWTED